jgi:DNA polymerase-3 subunit epsilon
MEVLIGLAGLSAIAAFLIFRRRRPPSSKTSGPIAELPPRRPEALNQVARQSWAPPREPRRIHLESIKKLRENWVVLDVETTGLGPKAEILEIAIVGNDGSILMSQLIEPKGRIQSGASEVHGITRNDVRGNPKFPAIAHDFFKHLLGKSVVCYNAEYEMKLIRQTCEIHGVPVPNVSLSCAMLAYAEYIGEPHTKRKGEFRWWKLVEAIHGEGIKVEASHRAVADAEATRQLVLAMQTRPPPQRG